MNTITTASNGQPVLPENANRTAVHGWKFLTPWGTTEGRDLPGLAAKKGQREACVYPLPQPGEKWGAWMSHPNPAQDGRHCGDGRFHVMKTIGAQYAPHSWWIWFAEGRGVTGQDGEKVGVNAIRLRRVRPEVFWRMLRFGWGKGANLEDATLYRANLYRANLENATLSGANLENANLENANLDRAYLLQVQAAALAARGYDVSKVVIVDKSEVQP